MQNLRDQLLKAGLITQEQLAQAESAQSRDRNGRNRGRPGGGPGGGQRPNGGHNGGQGGNGHRPKAPKPEGASHHGPGGDAPAANASAVAAADDGKPKISKKALMKQPVNRMMDMSDPRLLKIFQAIEEHRLRESPKGDIPFHFPLRDGRVRKIFVKPSVSQGLEGGALAIVENGELDRHVIVAGDAVPIIREVDGDAIRFYNA